MDPSPSMQPSEAPPSEAPPSEAPPSEAPPPRTPAEPSLLTRVLRPRVFGFPLLTVAALAFAAYVTLTNYVPKRIETLATEQLVALKRAENDRSVARIRSAEAEIRVIETDRWTNERILREQLGMTRRGEVPVR